ncbi:DUF1905 domain-containing protein [Oerskovia sp. M15]
MAGTEYEFVAELWRWTARSDTWVFAALPTEVSDEIADSPLPPAGFGSVKVEVTLGGSRWSTSVFPDAERRTFVLPVKAAVRRREGSTSGTPCGSRSRRWSSLRTPGLLARRRHS